VNYTNLRDLLAAGKWKEADVETTRAMLQAAKREEEGWFRYEDIENFSCEDLGIIDRLWLSASQGKFGFSVQKEIYESLGGTREYNREVWNKFGDRVGWRKGGSWVFLTYSADAPKAHLPSLFTVVDPFYILGGGDWFSRKLDQRHFPPVGGGTRVLAPGVFSTSHRLDCLHW